MDDINESGQSVQTAPVAPPPYGPPGTPSATGSPAPGKKRKGCIIAVAVVVALLLCGCIGSAVLVGRAMTSDDEVVSYSEADFDSAVAKMGLTWPELPEGADPDDYERVYTGHKPVDVTLSGSEISALMSYRHGSSYWPIKSMEVSLTGGNSAAASLVVAYAGRDWPVTVSGSGTASGPSLDLTISSASVAGITVPAEYLPLGAEFLESVINPRLANAGISIDTLEVTDEGVHIVGTTWESAQYVPKP
ncbi:MAG: hypothetical protein JXA36_08200 [Coriobacteriia bacterium]|nr:hypothetical protein [Coriobacteriia bacterium]